MLLKLSCFYDFMVTNNAVVILSHTWLVPSIRSSIVKSPGRVTALSHSVYTVRIQFHFC